jgi:acyl-CoA synthetase (AMP-forming)/AMP-acid ligase II
MRGHARTRPEGIAFVDGDVRLTWRDAATRVHRAANALRTADVGPGDRVVWLGQNSFRLPELLLACCEIGARFCPANWRQQPEELAFVIDDLAPKLVVWQEEEVGEAARATRAIATHPTRWLRHDSDGGTQLAGEYEDFVAAAPADDPDADASADAPLLLVYTAAFDGRPNAAMLPSRALVAQGVLMAPWSGIDDRSVFLNSGPLFHIGTFMPNLSTFVMGGTNVFVRRSDGEELCRAIATERVTGGFVVGPMVEAIVQANADGRYDLSSFRGKRGHPIFDGWVEADTSPWGRHPGGYGQTEVMGMATFTLLAPDGKGSHGRPSPLVDVRVVDADDNDVEGGETAEIVVRGTTVMCGYWNRPELNAFRSRNGWHHTNDLGRFEADGTFSFVAPLTRMLKSGAENVYPVEVENCVRRHPDVADCAVIGVPDPRWVQAVKAIVVPVSGASVTEHEVIEHCRARIASYKKPTTVAFVAALPRRGPAIDYDALDAQFGGGGYPGGTTRSV